ncbi:MAG: T9SS type A sorting domain-containing protein [Clostridium sp.]|nr:T9SS type A sorting domain-containing protein [Prevotella sp.]MCM1429030.1 T9SS type A sorting domain-containing protein [Clostridium sp.]
MKHSKSIILSLIFGLYGVLNSLASTPLITSAEQFSTNALSAEEQKKEFPNLINTNPNTLFVTDTAYKKEQHYLRVKFPDTFNMKEGENLVVVLRRPGVVLQRNPIAMEIHYKLRGRSEYETDVLARVYFTYRGVNTFDLSEPLPFSKLNERISKISGSSYSINDVESMQFIVTQNNGKYIVGYDSDGKGIRPVVLAGFQIYQVKDGERVVGDWVDRFHLYSDVNMRYYNYKFEHNQGVLHPANRKTYGTYNDDLLENQGGWNNFDARGKWVADTTYLQTHGIEMPDYSWVTAENDSIITNPNLKLQRTATVEHVVYAVQGEPIALHPYYTLPDVASYEESFIHWYDYTTGGQVEDGEHNELLDFLVDASGVFRSKDHGWFASKELTLDDIRVSADIKEIYTVDDFIAFMKKVNKENRGTSAKLMSDLDFKEYLDAGNTVEPIGRGVMWTGYFLGNNHVVKNLKIDLHEEAVGFFGTIGYGATIENLIIDSSCEFKGNKNVGFIGLLKYGPVTIRGVVNKAKLASYKEDGNVGGIIGCIDNPSGTSVNTLDVENFAFDGEITSNGVNNQNGLLIGWMRSNANCFDVRLKNVVVTSKSDGFLKGYELCRRDSYGNHTLEFVNCYDLQGRQGFSVIQENEFNTPEFLTDSGMTNWNIGETYPYPVLFESVPNPEEVIPNDNKAPRKYGTFATFMHSRNPFEENGDLRALCKDEFVIAADISQNFTVKDHVDNSTLTITEPIIQTRHIFRIKDGKKFADQYMANEKGNRAFIRKNLRHITASADMDFQVRLDFPYPVENTTRGVFYYKIDNSDYRRVCSRYFRVWKDGVLIQDRDEATKKMWVNDPSNLLDKDEDAIFYATAKFQGQGFRSVDGIDYYLCAGDGSFYRMMACNKKNAKEGRYTVQVVGTDYDGETIKLADSKDVDLLIQEYQITFLPETSSVMVTEEELKKMPEVSNERLELRYGTPSDVINFDEYRYLEVADSLTVSKPSDYIVHATRVEPNGDTQSGNYFRWPVSWEQSNYGFGYNVRHDYAMQMIVNNQVVTPYHSYGLAPASINFGGDGPGLFDRLYYDTQGAQKGYFYYVNAADDPGIIGRLRLDTFCPGSKIHVSCWISEFSSNSEAANLSLNFVARLKNGERIPLHSHITGYASSPNDYERRKKWLYVYSSFVPILTDKDFDIKELSHYEIEIDNNSKSSIGADYAVDDIRVYTVQPLVYARQLDLVCMESHSVGVQLSTDFEILMQSLAEEETEDGQPVNEFELYYTLLDKKVYDEAMAGGMTYEKAFNTAVLRYKYDGEKVSTYGKLKFKSNYNSHVDISSADTGSEYAYRKDDNGHRLIVLNTEPTDNKMMPGKEYIAVLIGHDPRDPNYVINEPTARDFNVEDDCTMKCVLTVASSHTIKIDGEVRNQSDEIDACRNQSPVVQVDLYAEVEDENGHKSTQKVEENAVFDWYDGSMDEFVEQKEGDLTLWDALGYFREVYPAADDLRDEPKGVYTKEMKQLINKYVVIDPTGEKRPKLYLAQSSYIFPPLVLPEGAVQRDEYVLAVPIPKEKENLLICTQPTEVHIVVKQRAPRLAQGISTIAYPPAITDVPLRLSLKSIKAATDESTPLVLPFRTIMPVTENVTDMCEPGGGSLIYLAGTKDPEYLSLSGEGKEDNELWAIGEVLNLVANKDDVEDGMVALQFYPEMHFKEGYEYHMRFLFEEAVPQASENEGVCSGHVVFTVKIVPEYQQWIGSENLNWNNDANWRRVSSSELLASASDFSDYVTDGNNAETSCFAPLDFTRTIIPQGNTVPELFNASMDSTLQWNSTPSENEIAGDATPLVQFDMIQDVKEMGIFCRPWLAHWCDQIQFKSGAEIGNQQYLNYNRAWVDFEVTPRRWYTLASPLQGVFAGDMYLPCNGARQTTPYFKEIYYDSSLNNRFNPAVFQRAWNKASAIVYNFNGNPGNTTNVSVLTTWSNVFNDVAVNYSAGQGFSIKTDLANMTGTRPDKVLFRLPKADSSYSYFNEDGNSGDLTGLNRSNAYKLNPTEGTFTVEAATEDNKLFLVGNPFMAHLDIKAFLEENSDVISSKYWILEGDRQTAAIMSNPYTITGTENAPRYLAPMQGFFVEAKESCKSLTLRYNAGMSATVNNIEKSADIYTRGMESSGPDVIRITVKESGSSALIALDRQTSSNYNEAEDVMFVYDESLDAEGLVYTSGFGTAMTINSLPEITSTEIGVMTAQGGEVTLLFEGAEVLEGLMLYDAVADTYTDLYNGIEVKTSGTSSRRLFIVSSKVSEMSPDLSIVIMDGGVRVTSPNGAVTAKVFDLNGNVAADYIDGGNEVFISLDKGIYVIQAADALSTVSQKIFIKK